MDYAVTNDQPEICKMLVVNFKDQFHWGLLDEEGSSTSIFTLSKDIIYHHRYDFLDFLIKQYDLDLNREMYTKNFCDRYRNLSDKKDSKYQFHSRPSFTLNEYQLYCKGIDVDNKYSMFDISTLNLGNNGFPSLNISTLHLSNDDFPMLDTLH